MVEAIIERTQDEIPLDLLLLSDPSEEVIAEYINLRLPLLQEFTQK